MHVATEVCDVDSKLEQLSVNAGSAPERSSQAHLTDQLANFESHPRLPNSSTRFPAPERAEACAMPAHNCFRPHNHDRIQDGRRKPVQQDENETIRHAEGRALGSTPTQHA